MLLEQIKAGQLPCACPERVENAFYNYSTCHISWGDVNLKVGIDRDFFSGFNMLGQNEYLLLSISGREIA
jgi:hypothetical protein